MKVLIKKKSILIVQHTLPFNCSEPDQHLLKHSLNERLELLKMAQQIKIQVK